jgi:hypothetical protein
MLEFICPTCGTFSLEDAACESCTARADDMPTSLAS